MVTTMELPAVDTVFCTHVLAAYPTVAVDKSAVHPALAVLVPEYCEAANAIANPRPVSAAVVNDMGGVCPPAGQVCEEITPLTVCTSYKKTDWY